MTSTEQKKSTPRRGSAWRRFWVVLLAVVLLSAFAVVGPTMLVWGIASGKQFKDADRVPQRDVALVLGAGVQPNGEPSPYLRARLNLAADAYKAGKVKVLLVSGDNRTHDYNEPKAMQKYLVNTMGIPEEHIVMDYAGLDTYSSCIRAKQIFGVNALTVVTQSYHLPRAVAACQFAGVDAVGLGDSTVKDQFPRPWRYGMAREVLANGKLLWEKAAGKEPILGQKEDGVRKALESRR